MNDNYPFAQELITDFEDYQHLLEIIIEDYRIKIFIESYIENLHKLTLNYENWRFVN